PFHGERLAEPAGGRARARRPVGRAHAGVADGVAAAATRLRHDPPRLLPRHLLAGEIWSPEGALPQLPLARPYSPPRTLPLARPGRARPGRHGGGRAHPARDRD